MSKKDKEQIMEDWKYILVVVYVASSFKIEIGPFFIKIFFLENKMWQVFEYVLPTYIHISTLLCSGKSTVAASAGLLSILELRDTKLVKVCG